MSDSRQTYSLRRLETIREFNILRAKLAVSIYSAKLDNNGKSMGPKKAVELADEFLERCGVKGPEVLDVPEA